MIEALSEFMGNVEGKEEKGGKKRKRRNKEENKRKGKNANRPYVIKLGINLINIERMYNVTYT